MNIKQFILYPILILTTFLSCGQTKNGKEMTITQYTEEDILNLDKTVAHFEEEPNYGVRIVSANCNFEILINDKKVFSVRKNKKGSVINEGYAPINYGILKSGIQQITVRMLPAVVDRKTEIKHLTLGNAQLDIEIVADDFMEGESTGEYSVFAWESPKETKYVKSEGIEIPYFTQPNLPFYEYKATFKAEVPYVIDGWSKSVNLFTDNDDELKALTEEAVVAYKELSEILGKNKKDELADLLYNSEKITAQQLYHSKESIKEQWFSYTKRNKEKEFRIMPLENFRLVFYGNGKMIGLEQIGPKYQRESVLWSKYVKEGSKYYSLIFYNFLLHRKKPGAKLEVL